MTKTANPSTKEKLLDAGQRLMLERGFTATTLDEICAEAGLTKGSFFHYFKGKEEFGAAVLDHYWTVGQQSLQSAPYVQLADPLERLHGYLDLFIALAWDPHIENSCLFGNFSQEVAPTHDGLRAVCAHGFARWAEQIARDLDDAKRTHAPAAAFDSVSVAEHLIAVYEGSLILAKAKGGAQVLEENIEHFRRYLESLFANDAGTAAKRRTTGRRTNGRSSRRR
jgi:TetR/AcrR family transcriptional repressor of nem operon